MGLLKHIWLGPTPRDYDLIGLGRGLRIHISSKFQMPLLLPRTQHWEPYFFAPGALSEKAARHSLGGSAFKKRERRGSVLFVSERRVQVDICMSMLNNVLLTPGPGTPLREEV